LHIQQYVTLYNPRPQERMLVEISL